TISIIVTCYNDEENVTIMSDELTSLFKNELKNYNYEILFIDNKSLDNTREEIRKICKNDKGVKAIFNAKNFGQFKSPYYALLNTTGDCTVSIAADFQEPVEIIPKFVKEWEDGNKIVCGIKNKSKESKIKYLFRGLGYKLIRKYSDVETIDQFTGFGLYDRAFMDVLRKLNDPEPYFRGIVAELGFEPKMVYYTQAERKHGKTSNNIMTLLDAGMIGVTTYTKKEIHIATLFGFLVAVLSFVGALVYLILKLCMWDSFNAGIAPLIIGMFFLGGIQIFLISFIGEYIVSINKRVLNRPLVVEEERINF
ncbi:MAG: glycosyltransferase family 2 protein, partial [Bacilli bacterium]|nr:glycosyltransferase family 2 protein [Bacilli bacterium]